MTVINKFVLVIVVDYPSNRMFNHFDKVAVSLDKCFLRTCKQPFLILANILCGYAEPFFVFSYTCKHALFVGMLLSCADMFPAKEGGMQVLAGLAPSLVARKMITPNYFFRTCKCIFFN